MLISGSFEYDSEESLVILRDYLLANAPWSCELLVFRSEEDEVSLEPLDDRRRRGALHAQAAHRRRRAGALPALLP